MPAETLVNARYLERIQEELNDIHAVAADAQAERDELRRRINDFATGFTIETIDHDLRDLTR